MDAATIIKQVTSYLSEDSRDFGIVGIVSESEVKGYRQSSDCEIFDHEFVDQRAMYDDDYFGEIYFPIGNGEYIKARYWM